MAAEDDFRLTFSFEACLDLFTTASIKMEKAANDSFKDNRRLLYASLMKMFFNSKKEKGGKFSFHLKLAWTSLLRHLVKRV